MLWRNTQNKIDNERCEEKGKRIKAEEELLAQTATHEAEVKLRLKFESKLNTMHAVHRELNDKYSKALITIESLRQDNSLLKKSNSELATQLDSLKLIRVDLDVKLTNDTEKLSTLTKDIKFKNKYIEDFTERFQDLIREKENLAYRVGVLVKEVDKHKLEVHLLNDKLDFKETENANLTKDLNSVKTTLEESKLLYLAKVREIEQLKKLHQGNEVEIVGFYEIQREKDERIDELKASLELLKQMYDEEEQTHISAKAELENLSEIHMKMESELNDTIEKYKVTNNQRFLTEIELKHKTDEFNDLKESEKELEKVCENYKRQIENDEIKIIDLKREVESRKMKASNITTQFNLKISHLNERIAKLTETINIERMNRETFNEKIENEQKANANQNVQLLNTQSIIKDKELEIKDLKIRLEVLEKTYVSLNDQNFSTQELANNFRVSLENIERELIITTKMFEKSEQECHKLNEELKANTQSSKAKLQYEQNLLNMEIEDYLAYITRLEEESSKQIEDLKTEIIICKSIIDQYKLASEDRKTKIESLQMIDGEKTTFIKHLQNEVQRLQLSYNMLTKTNEIKRKQTSMLEAEKNKVKNEISKFRVMISSKDNQIKKSESIIKELKESLSKIEVDYKALQKDYSMKNMEKNFNTFQGDKELLPTAIQKVVSDDLNVELTDQHRADEGISECTESMITSYQNNKESQNK